MVSFKSSKVGCCELGQVCQNGGKKRQIHITVYKNDFFFRRLDDVLEECIGIKDLPFEEHPLLCLFRIRIQFIEYFREILVNLLEFQIMFNKFCINLGFKAFKRPTRPIL